MHIIPDVARKVFMGIRLSPNLKKKLEDIAAGEERSVSQLCELLLRTGVESYEKDGPKYLQRFLARPKREEKPQG